uniref:Uncharacterized protein n=1 Tax=Noccaea caerulescens TaxID=107243 RepID=A0A1J3CUL6_NOCCA
MEYSEKLLNCSNGREFKRLSIISLLMIDRVKLKKTKLLKSQNFYITHSILKELFRNGHHNNNNRRSFVKHHYSIFSVFKIKPKPDDGLNDKDSKPEIINQRCWVKRDRLTIAVASM